MKNINDSISYKSNDLDKKLNNNFEEAMKNSNFKNLVDKIKLPREILIKYTSTLEVSSSEYNNCLNCNNLADCNNKINGYCFLPRIIDGRIEFDYQACKYMNKKIKSDKYLDNIYLFDIPQEIKEARIKNIYKDDKNRYPAIKWITSFIKNYETNKKQKGLYLYGNFGCGKTYLIASLFNELANHGVKSAIIFWPEYLRDLKASFSTDFKEKFEYIKKVPLLLIDDIGAESISAWGRDEILCPLMQYRMQESLPTFFTSNLSIDMLESHFSVTRDKVDELKSRRIIERIIQMTDNIEMVSQNLRK